MSELMDRILTSETARRMLTYISPIYEDSYVGLWLQEAIAREYDSLLDIMETYPDQLFPETATWGLELWEQRFGLTVNPALSIEERRQRILLKRTIPKPLTPKLLRQRIFDITGRWADIKEHIGSFTFGVYVENNGDITIPADFGELHDYINKHKPAHLSYELAAQTSTTVKASVAAEWFRFTYPMTGQLITGTWPEVNIVGHVERVNVEAEPDARGYKHDYVMTGTKPDVNVVGVISPEEVLASPQVTPYKFGYPMTSPDKQTGTEPDINTVGGIERADLSAETEARGYVIQYPMCGTRMTGEN